MEKGLLKRIGKKIILPLAIAGIVGGGCAKKYEIDGSKVSFSTVDYSVIEKKDNAKITYSCLPFQHIVSAVVVKNKGDSLQHKRSERYSCSNPADASVINFYRDRFKYLRAKKDSIDLANNKEKNDFGLKVFE